MIVKLLRKLFVKKKKSNISFTEIKINYTTIKHPIAEDYPIYSAKCQICEHEFNHGWGRLLMGEESKTICPTCKSRTHTMRMPLP